MPKGILFDSAGNMSAVHVSGESVLSDLYEHIGSRVVLPLFIKPGMNLWVDAAGADRDGAQPNAELTRVVASLGLDHPIYGDGVFLGCEARGEHEPPVNLSNDDRLHLVLTHIRGAFQPVNH